MLVLGIGMQVLLFFYFSEYIQYNRDNYVFILKV